MNDEATLGPDQQLLHLVFGGTLKSGEPVEFENLDKLDIVGIFPDYASAHKAWQAAAFRTADNANIRYFVVHLHKLLEPKS